MQTKREWLAERGLAIAGARGKFSNAAKEALAKAEKDGVKFAEVNPVKPVRTTGPKVEGKKTEAKPKVKSDPTQTEYISPSDYRFPESEYRLLTADGKPHTQAGMRNVCDTCRVSFVNHLCDAPALFGATVRIGKK
jgi:hypothetical protein